MALNHLLAYEKPNERIKGPYLCHQNKVIGLNLRDTYYYYTHTVMSTIGLDGTAKLNPHLT